eukprot:450256_1
MEEDIDYPPLRKKLRINNMNMNNDDNPHTRYVPPAITGILPSIRPGSLPRIAHNPPPFSNLSKKDVSHLKKEGDDGDVMINDGNDGLLGRMFNWCKLAGWVMLKLEWTPCGFEYDEATHSIDTSRPLYRCSYCLKYRNISGWGQHENWCQLKIALKEYETKVKILYSEWNYQKNGILNENMSTMTALDHNTSSPPPSTSNNKDKDKKSTSSTGSIRFKNIKDVNILEQK